MYCMMRSFHAPVPISHTSYLYAAIEAMFSPPLYIFHSACFHWSLINVKWSPVAPSYVVFFFYHFACCVGFFCSCWVCGLHRAFCDVTLFTGINGWINNTWRRVGDYFITFLAHCQLAWAQKRLSESFHSARYPINMHLICRFRKISLTCFRRKCQIRWSKWYI